MAKYFLMLAMCVPAVSIAQPPPPPGGGTSEALECAEHQLELLQAYRATLPSLATATATANDALAALQAEQDLLTILQNNDNGSQQHMIAIMIQQSVVAAKQAAAIAAVDERNEIIALEAEIAALIAYIASLQ